MDREEKDKFLDALNLVFWSGTTTDPPSDWKLVREALDRVKKLRSVIAHPAGELFSEENLSEIIESSYLVERQKEAMRKVLKYVFSQASLAEDVFTHLKNTK